MGLQYLRSDADHAAGTGAARVLAREVALCARDMAVAARHARGAGRLRVPYWMARRITAAATTPLALDDLLLFRFGTPGGPARVFVRRNQSDLLILWQIFIRRYYELNDVYALTRPLDTLDTIVDLGGNTGLAAAYLNARYQPRRLLTVEPIAESRAVLHRNAVLAGGAPWTVDSHAVTGEAGVRELDFAVSAFWDTCTAVPDVHELRRTRPWRLENHLTLPSRTLPARPVGELLDAHGIETVDLLKVDIEGTEADLFAEPRPWLERVRRIVLEIHDKYIDGPTVRTTLKAAGFRQVPPRRPQLQGFNPVELYVREGVPA